MSDEPINQDELKRLRKAYGELPAAEPGELTDARIRAEARRAVQKQHGMRPATWIPIVSIAAAMGFAVILVPNLLLESPQRQAAPATVALAPLAESAARKSAQEEAVELDRVEVTGSRMADMQAERMVQSPAARTRQESVASAEAMLALPEQRAALLAEAIHDASFSADDLRAELDTAPEQQWRVTLVTLRDNQRRELAERLMPDYRRKFDFDESLTLDMLVAEVSQ